ncbi:hypothetical protein AB0K00_56230 [Dactylosporangium sp. NPDC049525]|uniref:hypothetical protein n=1 Tax=Dactylosporangium sp. NPDC049525 TaxID=3154730 RepID=UPI0034263698
MAAVTKGADGPIPMFTAQDRIAWLLRVNRMCSPLPRLRSARQFAKEFALPGMPELAPSQVSRWESGASSVSVAALRRYEEVLGLPGASLRHVRDAVLRWFDPRPMRAETTDGADVHHVLDRVRGTGSVDEATWLAFCNVLRSHPGLVLHPRDLWDGVAYRLLTEMVSAEGGAWMVRQEAISRMLEHADAMTATAIVCIDVAVDPGIPSYVEPISLLDGTPDSVASMFLARQLGEPLNIRARQAALQTVIRKARAGHFREPFTVGLLAQAARELLAMDDHDLRTMPMTVDFVRLAPRWGVPVTPRWSRRIVEDPMVRSVWLDGLTLPVAQTGPLCRRLALSAQSRLEVELPAGDAMLAQLLQEMLFAADSDTRLYATLTVSATPYRRPVAELLAAELHNALRLQFDPMTATTMQAITILGEAGHRSLLIDLLADPNLGRPIRLSAANAAPHCSGDQSVDNWRRAFDVQRSAWLHNCDDAEAQVMDAITAAIGTAGNVKLLQEMSVDALLPSSTRMAAAWWLANQPDRCAPEP